MAVPCGQPMPLSVGMAAHRCMAKILERVLQGLRQDGNLTVRELGLPVAEADRQISSVVGDMQGNVLFGGILGELRAEGQSRLDHLAALHLIGDERVEEVPGDLRSAVNLCQGYAGPFRARQKVLMNLL